MTDRSDVRCPTDAELTAFAVGSLDETVFDHVATHVATCPDCERALGAHDDTPDELVGHLRRLPEVCVDAGRRVARALRDGPCRLGRFELVEELGKGSFGHVFRARDCELDRVVALKVQRAGPLGSAEEDERFLREARSAARLVHPGIVALYEAGRTEEGICYLVTELIEGVTLAEHLHEPPADFVATARLLADVAMALQYAHAHGVVHRDVKPSNILIDRAGRPHVTDFGLAKRDAADAVLTPAGEVLGTPAYMSPELARGDAHLVDGRSDVYSLGVILYEAMTGERPFRGKPSMLLQQVLEEEPRLPHRLNDRVPRDLETVCLKAIAKAPARRYQSAQELADDLLRFARGEPVRARPIGAAERSWRWCRRNPLAVGLFLAVCVASALGFGYLSHLSSSLVHRAALESAAQYAEMLELVNDVYSSEVVERAGHHGVEATADYASRAGAVPLPATLLTLLLERVGERGSGMRGRHYSAYPFRSRAGGGPHDAFERDALAWLERDPATPYYHFVDHDGRPVLRYASARIMGSSCVGCHNVHPDSTRRDWKVGDVRGVLEIIRPLERDVERTRQGLEGTFTVAATASVALLVLIVLLLVAGRRR